MLSDHVYCKPPYIAVTAAIHNELVRIYKPAESERNTLRLMHGTITESLTLLHRIGCLTLLCYYGLLWVVVIGSGTLMI